MIKVFSRFSAVALFKWLMVLAAFACMAGCMREKPVSLKVDIDLEDSRVRYGISRLTSLRGSGVLALDDKKPDYTIRASMDPEKLAEEAFRLEVSQDELHLTGGGPAGIMYGLLDIKEQLQNGNRSIAGKEESPYLGFRAIKFNLPWNAYRSSNTLKQHTETVRDTLFWRDFLDMMAENRFNKLTLWNLHPFNYLVKLEKYPEANSFSDDEFARWQQFWHTLFKMAQDRHIETYLVNWNIFVPREFAEYHNVSEISKDEKDFYGEGDTSEIIKDYTRESVRETIDTYPNLTGVGITLGEGMGGMTAEEREAWLLETIIEGARQAKRKIKFIHRVPLSASESPGGSTSALVERMTRNTLDTLTCFEGPINIELKFNWSHAHSSTKLVKVHGGQLSDAYWNPLPTNYYLAWMMRNEDFFILRWGQTDFIREHLKENVHPYVNGYYVGSETYIPARDYITSLKGASSKYAFERQWMFYKSWGHLLYNPGTPDSFFVDAFERRFPGLGKTLFEAQAKACRVPLIIASYWNARWDFTLYAEGMLGFNDGPPAVKLLSLETMANKNPMDPRYLSIKSYLDSGKTNTEGKITPVRLADSLDAFCNTALSEVSHISPGQNVDLRYEKTDIEAWSYLGLYFSAKLKAAVAYQQYKNTGKPEYHQQSVAWLEKATEHWARLVDVTKDVYQPVPIEHKGFRTESNLFHWSIVQEEVLAEVEWLKSLRR